MPHLASTRSTEWPRVTEDLTAARLQARAARRLAALGGMTGGIVHDFRNILTIIEAGLRLAERSACSPDDVREFIAGARDGVDRGLKLTALLLTFAKQQELEPCSVDANELLRKLELFLKYSAGPRLRVVMQLTPDIPKCVVDASQFDAAILNLVLNARDATPADGEVLISTDQYRVPAGRSPNLTGNTYVRVRVSDTGQGMSRETIDRIFDPFFTTRGDQGTGLGLPQVGAFMRLMGGHLSVASKCGAGTTFELWFPASPEDARAAATSSGY
jgi:signal transduction histidine kinase